jgi:hypothetical protein
MPTAHDPHTGQFTSGQQHHAQSEHHEERAQAHREAHLAGGSHAHKRADLAHRQAAAEHRQAGYEFGSPAYPRLAARAHGMTRSAEIASQQAGKIGRDKSMTTTDRLYQLARDHGLQVRDAGEGKIHQTMSEFKRGELHSGSKRGPKVKSRRQAIAIALSQAGKSNRDTRDSIAALARDRGLTYDAGKRAG